MSKFWNEDRVAELENLVGDVDTQVSQEAVAEIAATLGTSARSVGSKLRNMGYDVQKASEAHKSDWDEASEAELRTFLERNEGKYTYAEIAASFKNGAFSPKSVQGKVLSMELTDAVKPAEKVAPTRVYTDEEEATFIQLALAGKYIEEIADALNKTINSVRGKALSLSRKIEDFVMPRQKESHASVKEDAVDAIGDLSKLSVTEIAEKTGKTERGVKTLLTRRRIACADYDGAKKAEKREQKAAS